VIWSAAAIAAVLAGFIPGAARDFAPRDRGPERTAPQPTGTIRGVVLDTANGTGVGRVSVRLQSTGRTVITDDEGRFEIPDVAPGHQDLYVSAVDFILVKRAVTVTAGSTIDTVIVLSEGTGMLVETWGSKAVSAAPRVGR
jgi:hypothetical protein